MPQLKSGRHVALSISPYLDALSSGTPNSQYFAIIVLRLNARSPETLRNHVVVGSFVEGDGISSDARCYDFSYCVADILEGRSDWTPEEVEELPSVLAEPLGDAWLRIQFAAINRAIQTSPVWRTDLVSISASGEADVPMLKRAVILKAALEPNAMEQLRGATHGSRSVPRSYQ